MLPLSIPRVLSSSKLPFRKRYHPGLAVMFSIRVEMCAPAPKFYPNEIILFSHSKSKNLAFTTQTLTKKNAVSCHDTVGALLIWIEVPGRKLFPTLQNSSIIFSNLCQFAVGLLNSCQTASVEFKCEVLKGGRSIVTRLFSTSVEIKDIHF